MKILFVGPGRCGKDTACELTETHTGLVNAGTFSKYLAPYVARETGVSEAQAYATRHTNRDLWMRIGNELRANDPALLARMAFEHGDVSGGVRGAPEIEAIRRDRVADLIIWLDRDVPADPTLEYGPEWADVRVSNAGSIGELESRLVHLFGLMGLLR